jgi:hypothetical protein
MVCTTKVTMRDIGSTQLSRTRKAMNMVDKTIVLLIKKPKKSEAVM